MLGTHASTLLLYPEWIIWIAIGLGLVNIVLSVICVAAVARTERYEAREISRLRASYADLWAAHTARRDRLSAVAAELETLRRAWRELQTEHGETVAALAELIPDDLYDRPDAGYCLADPQAKDPKSPS